MSKKSSAAVVAALGTVAIAVVGAWNRYQRYITEEVPYTTIARVGDAELRRYPATVLVETVAESEREAFGRLFRNISGANGGKDSLKMTAPVAMPGRGTELSMTAPVEVEKPGHALSMTTALKQEAEDDGVRMAFYLPAEYDLESAPRPTDETVHLVVVPERTLAVCRFSWLPTDDRVARETERLFATLERADISPVDEPFYMGYDAPLTLPFLRRNEVAVEVAR